MLKTGGALINLVGHTPSSLERVYWRAKYCAWMKRNAKGGILLTGSVPGSEMPDIIKNP